MELQTRWLHFRVKSHRTRQLFCSGRLVRANKCADFDAKETVLKENVSGSSVGRSFRSSARGLMTSPPHPASCFRFLRRQGLPAAAKPLIASPSMSNKQDPLAWEAPEVNAHEFHPSPSYSTAFSDCGAFLEQWTTQSAQGTTESSGS